MAKVVLAGRTDLDDYFKLSGVLEAERLTHTPFLVFVEIEGNIQVRIVDNLSDLLKFSDDTQVMGQWRGEWRSDFFQFTVKHCRNYIDAKYAPLKNAKNVIKWLGPQGGFRYLSYDLPDEDGKLNNRTVHMKSDAIALENFFEQHGIAVESRKVK
jgi:hypothetical protein